MTLFDKLEAEVVKRTAKGDNIAVRDMIVLPTTDTYLKEVFGVQEVRAQYESKDRDPFDLDKWEAAFEEAATPDLKAYILASFERAVQQVGENWTDIASDFDTAIRKTLKGSTAKIVESVTTLKDEISQVLSDNFDKPASELRSILKERFAMYKESRIATIARTTSTYATGASQKEAWTGLDIESVWFSSRRNSRPAHSAADGQRADKEGYFTVGGERMQWPASGSSAANNVNCQCYLRPRMKA